MEGVCFKMGLGDVYGLNFPIKSLAVANEFVTNANKACYALGQNLRPFCIYANETQKENGVIEIASFGGICDSSKTMVDEIIEYRKSVYEDWGISVDISDELKRKLLLFDYLMTISVCYVEVPKYTTQDGIAKPTFDKFLCTRNPQLMATWMGDTASAMQAKYSSRLKCNQFTFDDNIITLVKLNMTGKGNTITQPRNPYSVQDMTCTPLFMLHAFVRGFEPVLQNNIVEFRYLKDNKTVRTLNTTTSEKILMDYYDDMNFVQMMLNGVDITTVQQGALQLSSKINRGYIKVPELGSSIYDSTGCRSLNIARLLTARVVDEVDRSFIHVDLNSTVQGFKESVERLATSNPDAINTVFTEITGKIPEDASATAVNMSTLFDDVDSKVIFLSTSFLRLLHTYMIERPALFPLYTGLPSSTTVSSASSVSIGVDTFDF